MATDFSTLQDIFKMISPADLRGAQKISIGNKVKDVNLVEKLIDILYSVGTGANSIDDLVKELDELNIKADDETKKSFKRIISLYSSGDVKSKSFGDGQNICLDNDGTTTIKNITFDQIVGKNVKLNESNKKMGIILCNSGFLSPAIRGAERVELFMNYIPSIVASRMVPLLDVEFALNRIPASSSETSPQFWAPGLMKFLLGNDQSGKSSPQNAQMFNVRNVQNRQGENQVHHATAGMEMFTSPQTLVNPDAARLSGNRYVDVLDPFRPLMTIESFTINVTPTVGMYSYKKGSLVFKLHDRSRLSEIADFIRPQVYQSLTTAPTVWITYGWRHPNEVGNPYADFINSNMLIREAYQIINSSFSFDAVGQVTITMELWTKGLPDLRTMKINESKNSSKNVFSELKKLAEDIAKYRAALNLGPVEGANKEIRSFMLLDSAERGDWPDMTQDEIKGSIESLKKSLNEPDAKIDKSAAKGLVDALNKLYINKDKNLNFKEQLKTKISTAINQKFKETRTGSDPFIPTADKNKIHEKEANKLPHPLTSLYDAWNAYKGEAEVKTLTKEGFNKQAVSFGKLVSVFFANALPLLDGIDEMQMFFYQFNEHAGAASGANIAEFPIDMPVFLDQYLDLVERKGSENVTLEEFLKLTVDAQLSDDRAIGYGFRTYYAPYDPANKHDAAFKKNVKQDDAELKMGPFQKPVIEVYIETVNKNTKGNISNVDSLSKFEQTVSEVGLINSGRKGDYTTILRVHIFDKQNCPYKLATTILRGDTSQEATFYDAAKENLTDFYKQDNVDQQTQRAGFVGKLNAIGDKEDNGKITNKSIKQFVSQMVPSIIFGGNASSVISANLASKQDPLLSTTQMQGVAKNSGKPSTMQPNGGGIGNLPLRVIPASMGMTTLGCPLLTYGQLFFIDFNTGTTVDNIYGLTGLTHTISQGKFESNLTLTFYDAYGKFEGAPTISKIYESNTKVQEDKDKKENLAKKK